MTDFLKNLRAALESGDSNEDVKKQFDQIVEKADAINPDQVKAIEEKAAKLQESADEKRKPMTFEEVQRLNKLALEQQTAIDNFELNGRISAILVNIDLVIEKLEGAIKDFKGYSETFRSGKLGFKESKLLVIDVLREINKYEKQVDEPTGLKKPVEVDGNGRDLE